MEIKKIKLHQVLTCDENETIEEVATKLKENQERRIFVVDKKNKLVGIITTTDIVYKAIGKTGISVSEIMTKNVEAVDSKDELDKALEIMNRLKSFVCPVTDEGKIVGLISYHDLMSYVMDSLNE
jgi:CBS domain-containing protein